MTWPSERSPDDDLRPRLSRGVVPDTAAAPVRIVHIGLGNFHRAHQAWYTARSRDAREWGIAAFTGRSPRAAEPLAAQDGLYTLIERGDSGDHPTIVSSISEAVDGADQDRFNTLLAAPQTAIVTLTITEPGYRLDTDGLPDRDDPAVAADLDLLQTVMSGDMDATVRSGGPGTSLGRLVLGLHHRRLAGGDPLAIVSCDNIPSNGSLVRRAVTALAETVDPDLARWITDTVSFVSTSVDRITPGITDADVETAGHLTGYTDLSPVVTEPFTDWVLCGEFPGGRPSWEDAGARFVDDIDAFERRKLRLLNGAHSLLAYLGPLRGHTTVADAVADPVCRDAMGQYWQEAIRQLPAGLDAANYCDALLTRFQNTRIEHRLAVIGVEAVSKLPVRTVPVAAAERADGRDASGCATALAAWITLALRGALPTDAKHQAVEAAVAADPSDRVRRLLGVLDEHLAADDTFTKLVNHRVHHLQT